MAAKDEPLPSATRHHSEDELADHAAGLLTDDESLVIDVHVAGCAACSELIRAIPQISELLGAEPAPTMPADVALRLERVIEAEQRQRDDPAKAGEHPAEPATPEDPEATSGAHLNPVAGSSTATASQLKPSVDKPSLGSFGSGFTPHTKAVFLRRAAAALVAACLMGFVTYFGAASAGLNEPPQAATAVDVRNLGPAAQTIREETALDEHRFSRAWSCARKIVPGSIKGLTWAWVDGAEALLVYTDVEGASAGGATKVTVVKGCDGTSPSAGPIAVIPR